MALTPGRLRPLGRVHSTQPMHTSSIDRYIDSCTEGSGSFNRAYCVQIVLAGQTMAAGNAHILAFTRIKLHGVP